MRVFLIVLLVVLAPARAIAFPDVMDDLWTRHDPASDIRIDHMAWENFVIRYVSHDDYGVARVNYGGVTAADRAAIDAYAAALQAVDPLTLNRDEQLAYWINLYNAQTVIVILDNYPVASIRRIKPNPFAAGPWRIKNMTVNGRPLSLDDIEHGIIRPIWRDPRIHYVFNCAALSCPNLRAAAYTGEEIEAQLDAAAFAYINNFRGVEVSDKGEVIASRIYQWYEDDWGGEAEVLAEFRKYAAPDLRARLEAADRINGYRYDWALNDTATAGSLQPSF